MKRVLIDRLAVTAIMKQRFLERDENPATHTDDDMPAVLHSLVSTFQHTSRIRGRFKRPQYRREIELAEARIPTGRPIFNRALELIDSEFIRFDSYGRRNSP